MAVVVDDRQAIEPDPAPVDWVALGGMVAEALDVLGTEPPPPPPPPPDPPDEPEPPLDTPDWATLLDHLDTAQATLATATLAAEDCAAELVAARQWVELQTGATQ